MGIVEIYSVSKSNSLKEVERRESDSVSKFAS